MVDSQDGDGACSSRACPGPGTQPGTQQASGRPAERPCLHCRALRATYVLTVDVSFTGAAEQFPPQEVPVVLQEGQVEVAEELHVLVLHPQFLGRVPVNDLAGHKEAVRQGGPRARGSHSGVLVEASLLGLPFIHSHTYSFTHSVTHSLTHSFT